MRALLHACAAQEMSSVHVSDMGPLYLGRIMRAFTLVQNEAPINPAFWRVSRHSTAPQHGVKAHAPCVAATCVQHACMSTPRTLLRAPVLLLFD